MAGVLRSHRQAGVNYSREPVQREGRALLVAQWKGKHLFSPSFCRNGISCAVTARQHRHQCLMGTVAQCFGPGRTLSPRASGLLRAWRGCRLCCPWGNSSAECLWSFLKLLAFIFIYIYLHIPIHKNMYIKYI